MGGHSKSPPSGLPSSVDGGGNFGVGRPVLRVEDERLLRGGSRYVSDLIATSGALRVKVLRSPHAHARLLAIDAAVARTMPGVAAVLTADDLAGINDLPCDWAAPGMDVTPLHPVLARDRVRYAGEPVVAVAAETADAAQDALMRINVTYEKLPAVADQEAAMEEGAPRPPRRDSRQHRLPVPPDRRRHWPRLRGSRDDATAASHQQSRHRGAARGSSRAVGL